MKLTNSITNPHNPTNLFPKIATYYFVIGLLYIFCSAFSQAAFSANTNSTPFTEIGPEDKLNNKGCSTGHDPEFEISSGCKGEFCAGFEFSLISDYKLGISHFWDFGDGNVQSGETLDDVYHTYTLPGLYEITHIISDASGCKDTFTKKLLVLPKIICCLLEKDIDDGYFDIDDDVVYTVADMLKEYPDKEIKINSGIIVKKGESAQIENKTLVFGPKGYIEIQGGQLVISNSTLKSVDSCGAFWNGIRVFNYVDLDRKTSYGRVYLYDNVIEKALAAVENQALDRRVYDINETSFVTAGTVIAERNLIKNNYIGVRIIHQADPKHPLIIPNGSIIKENEFLKDEPIGGGSFYSNNTMNAFIEMENLEGPIIKDNSFRNKASGQRRSNQSPGGAVSKEKE